MYKTLTVGLLLLSFSAFCKAEVQEQQVYSLSYKACEQYSVDMALEALYDSAKSDYDLSEEQIKEVIFYGVSHSDDCNKIQNNITDLTEEIQNDR